MIIILINHISHLTTRVTIHLADLLVGIRQVIILTLIIIPDEAYIDRAIFTSTRYFSLN